MSGARLSTLKGLSPLVETPNYAPSNHAPGIVHIGVGAFHKAHQAVYTDDALASGGGDWRITGVSLRSPRAAEELNPQNGLYTLIERGDDTQSARVISSIANVIHAPGNIQHLIDGLSEPTIRIVSLTVTEKAYGIDRRTGGVDLDHPAATDLNTPNDPSGVLGLLVAALARRRKDNVQPFTVLCCDNLPENGAFLKGGAIDFANRIDRSLGEWIAEKVPFPSTMVDRITPAQTPATLADAKRLTGVEDLAAIETEPFSQWVIEDHFSSGRPSWESGGAIFVDNVAPYENMKLRMLNGAHSMLAYAGFLSGHRYVSDVMQQPDLSKLVRRHISAAAGTLDPVPGIDLDSYSASLVQRFSNRNIAHETYQIAMDGTEKLPQRILKPAVTALERDQPLRPFAFATAAWMRYCLGHRNGSAEQYELRDPRQVLIAAGLKNVGEPNDIASFLFGLDSVFPSLLLASDDWREQVVSCLTTMIESGMTEAVRRESRIAF